MISRIRQGSRNRPPPSRTRRGKVRPTATGQVARVVPIPGGIGAIDAGVIGALVLYGADFGKATAGELIAHALALLVPLLAGSIPFALLPREIRRTKTLTP